MRIPLWNGRAVVVKMTALPHGTPSGYLDHACRCKKCRKAYNEYSLMLGHRRAEQAAEAIASGEPDPIPHGTQGYSAWRCRCDVCREAQMAKKRRLKEAKSA